MNLEDDFGIREIERTMWEIETQINNMIVHLSGPFGVKNPDIVLAYSLISTQIENVNKNIDQAITDLFKEERDKSKESLKDLLRRLKK